MTDHEHFYKKYISLTEWLHGMGHAEAGVMRTEDNDKRERLRVLNELIGLPYDKPYQFTAREAAERTPGFKKFVQEHGQELCAIRLIPLDPALPKLRMRGKTIAEAVGWLDKQNLDHAKYRVDFVPHPHSDIWATIFVVNQHGIFGEIIAGPHNQLTQGFEAGDPPISFSNDFEATLLSRPDQEAARHLAEIFRRLRVPDPKMQSKLHAQLGAAFAHDYLTGYFETTASDDLGLVFIDYNRILGNLYGNFTGQPQAAGAGALLSGQIGCTGKARGRVRIVLEPDASQIQEDEILVCPATTPDYLPLMQKSAAIVTDAGGILSHAAIVAREMGKPCLVATRSATTLLKTGQMVEVDCDEGVVRIMKEAT
jgi:phosphohistidine swiveling domain-containing protein